jgi:hypothetical protein
VCCSVLQCLAVRTVVCIQQCAAVRLVVYGSARVIVRLCGSVWQCDMDFACDIICINTI